MTTKDEALKLALEALENSMKFVWADPEREAGFDAIDAIKQALAAPVQEQIELAKQIWREDQRRIAELSAEIDRMKAAQPVAPDINAMVGRFLAWKLPKDFYPDSFIIFDREKHDAWGGYPNSWPTGTNLLNVEQVRQMLEHVVGTSPAAQRQWVGLTDDEVIKCTPTWGGTVEDVARAIEAKLKEKNT